LTHQDRGSWPAIAAGSTRNATHTAIRQQGELQSGRQTGPQPEPGDSSAEGQFIDGQGDHPAFHKDCGMLWQVLPQIHPDVPLA